jgi:hypothetical protein
MCRNCKRQVPGQACRSRRPDGGRTVGPRPSRSPFLPNAGRALRKSGRGRKRSHRSGTATILVALLPGVEASPCARAGGTPAVHRSGTATILVALLPGVERSPFARAREDASGPTARGPRPSWSPFLPASSARPAQERARTQAVPPLWDRDHPGRPSSRRGALALRKSRRDAGGPNLHLDFPFPIPLSISIMIIGRRPGWRQRASCDRSTSSMTR